jgi:hypothetical protein
MIGNGDSELRPRLARRGVAIIAVCAAALALSAWLFGVGYAEAHGHGGGEAAHAEPAHEEGEEAQGGAHMGEEENEPARKTESGAVAASILIALAGGALVPITLVAGRRREQLGPAVGAAVESGVARALRISLALLSMGAAVVHFAVIDQHIDEWWLTGTFFALVAAFQLVWALLVLLSPSRLLYVAGAVANALVAVTWVVSRTSGVPVGPTAGEPEAVGLPDVVATAFEVVLALGVVALLGAWWTRRPVRPAVSQTGSWAAGAAVVALTALALVILA